MLLYPSKLSCFDTIPACDRRTDRQTDRPMTTTYTAPAQLHAVESTAYINTYIHTHLYSAKNRENESEALAQDD